MMANPFKQPRVEITAKVKAVVFIRAGGPGALKCEHCGLLLRGKRFVYDHITAEAKQPLGAERKPVTAEQVQLLGECCYKEKDAQDTRDAAKSVRLLKDVAGIKRKGRPMAGSRASGWKRKMDGTTERR